LNDVEANEAVFYEIFSQRYET